MGKLECDRVITSCFINATELGYNEIFVIYDDSSRETIWRYSPKRYHFDYRTFIGMTKIDAVFYCDRKLPMKQDPAYLQVRW